MQSGEIKLEERGVVGAAAFGSTAMDSWQLAAVRIQTTPNQHGKLGSVLVGRSEDSAQVEGRGNRYF
jgi:hypothetical protein